jgi:hypothetical protein
MTPTKRIIEIQIFTILINKYIMSNILVLLTLLMAFSQSRTIFRKG